MHFNCCPSHLWTQRARSKLATDVCTSRLYVLKWKMTLITAIVLKFWARSRGISGDYVWGEGAPLFSPLTSLLVPRWPYGGPETRLLRRHPTEGRCRVRGHGTKSVRTPGLKSGVSPRISPHVLSLWGDGTLAAPTAQRLCSGTAVLRDGSIGYLQPFPAAGARRLTQAALPAGRGGRE